MLSMMPPVMAPIEPPKRSKSKNGPDRVMKKKSKKRKTKKGGYLELLDIDPVQEREVPGIFSLPEDLELQSGWGEEEVDIDPNDLDAQITRCKERIDKNILPELFEDKLKRLRALRRNRDILRLRWPGLGDEEANRMEFFVGLKEHLGQEGDENEVIPTIDAIMEGYRSKRLKCNPPGYVTYWSKVKKLTEARLFDWEEFLRWNSDNEGWKGFWVEGIRDSQPTRRYWKRRVCRPSRFSTTGRYTNEAMRIPVALRLARRPVDATDKNDPNTNLDPKRPMKENNPYSIVPRVAVDPATVADYGETKPPDETFKYDINKYIHRPQDNIPYKDLIFWMHDDTGTDICTISRSDVIRLRQASEKKLQADVPMPPLLGYIRVQMGDGTVRYDPVRAMQINIPGHDGSYMMADVWDTIEVAIAEDPTDPADEPIRLLGPWLRHRFYTATAPDRTNRLWIVKKRRRIGNLPDIPMGGSGDLPSVTMRRNADTAASLRAAGRAHGVLPDPPASSRARGAAEESPSPEITPAPAAPAAPEAAPVAPAAPAGPAPTTEHLEAAPVEEEAAPGEEEAAINGKAKKSSGRFWRRKK